MPPIADAALYHADVATADGHRWRLDDGSEGIISSGLAGGCLASSSGSVPGGEAPQEGGAETSTGQREDEQSNLDGVENIVPLIL